MLEGLPRRWLAVLKWLACLGAIACAALLLVRTLGAVSLVKPLLVSTSGYEEESLLVLWRRAHGGPIYTRLQDIPFGWSVFNWLYYVSYAGVVRLLGQADVWLPAITRLATLTGTLAGAALALLAFREVRPRVTAAVTVSFAALVGLGPLVGFWAITTRPDLWARVFEVGLVLVFLRFRSRLSAGAVVAMFLLAYAAWAFKQSSVTALAAVSCFLVLRRRWGWAAALAALMGAAVGLTLWLGGDTYRRSVLLTDYKPALALGHARTVAALALRKTPAIAVPLGLLAIAIARRPRLAARIWSDDYLLFAACGVVVSGLFAFATSAHGGSSDNYWLTTAFFGGLFVLASTRLAAPSVGIARAAAASWAVGWALQIAAVGAVFLGLSGNLSLRPADAQNQKGKACVADLPQPAFIEDSLLALPWVTGTDEPFIIGFGYPPLRSARVPVAVGGVGGLINIGHFAALALHTPDTATSPLWSPDRLFDGGDPARLYDRVGTCEGMDLYLRKPSP